MTGDIFHKLDLAARHAAPGAVTLILVLVGVTPTHLPYYSAIAPMLPLASVYYWGVHRPDLMPMWLIFLVGLLHDVLTDSPIGLHAAILLLCQWVLLRQRRFLAGRPFAMLWFGYVVVVVGVGLLEWIGTGLYDLAVAPARPVLIRAVLTIALFPPLAWLFIQVHRGFLRAGD